MRFIHTADWHLGNKMYDVDRVEEISTFLNWLIEYLDNEKIETLIIAGDVFDTINPSVETKTQYFNFLAEIQKTSCNNIVIIGGNHDSGALLDAPKELLKICNIHVVGSINNLKITDFVFELKNRKGNEIGICIAIPFCRESEIKEYLKKEVDEDSVFSYESYLKKLYYQAYKYADKLRGDRNIPIISTGHLYVTGLEGRLSKIKSNVTTDDGVRILDVLGTLGNVSSSIFPDNIDYVALGHIHYSSRVDKNPKIRYSGSPFVLGFDETNIQRFVLDVEVERNKQVDIKPINIPASTIYKRIEGSKNEISDALKILSNEKIEKRMFVEICYQKETGQNIIDDLYDEINSLPENVKVMHWKPIDLPKMLNSNFSFFDADEIKEISDKEIFTKLILYKTGLQKDSNESEKILNEYLPLFLKFAKEVENENN